MRWTAITYLVVAGIGQPLALLAVTGQWWCGLLAFAQVGAVAVLLED